MDKRICLLNDSFAPYLDGVANAVQNYAKYLNMMGTKAFVVTPKYPNSDDSQFDFQVIRLNTLAGNIMSKEGYTIGNPWDPIALKAVRDNRPNILHTHCLTASFFAGVELKKQVDLPMIFTYHTKYDVAIGDMINVKFVQDKIKSFLVSEIEKYCNEVWAVSDGAGKNLQSLGYQGDYIVMKNGVDLPKKRIEDDIIEKYTGKYDLPHNVPVFIYVGRLYWYKGFKLSFDSLAKLKETGKDFRMVLVGNGKDEQQIKKYCSDLKLDDKCIFVDNVYDREELMAWYSRADLLLFPSTFDTNGLVVREASACSLPAILIKDSCAAENVKDNIDGFLIEENSDAMKDKLLQIMDNKEMLKKVGENASENLYLSWEDAIKVANERYEVVLENYKRKTYL